MQGEVEQKAAVFHWRLKAFPSRNGRCISPLLSFEGRRWELDLYPDREGYVDLHVYVLHSDPKIDVRYSVGIRTTKGGTIEVRGSGTKTFDGLSSATVRVMETSELLRRREELLPQDVLTLTLQLKIEDGSSETVLKDACVQATPESNVADVSVQTVESNVADVSVQTVEESVSCGGKSQPSEKTGVDKIVEDVGKLWPNGDDTDVLLKVKHAEFKAHRTILAARTPALGAMFRHDTTEKASGEGTIDDCEPEVFEQLLYYVYKGAPDKLTVENASALYVLADKYLVSEVKALCVRCMRDTLYLDTFCDILTLSLMHREDELLKTATNFFSRNMVDVLKTVEWQTFMGEHKTWANEIIIRATELTAARYEQEKIGLLEQSML